MNITNILTRVRNQPIKKRLYQGVNGLIVQIAGNSIRVPHLLEYPKCGGTWVRNMMQTYLGGEPYFFDRFIKSNTVIHLHRTYNSRFSYPVVLFRDPRDVFVSYFFHEKALADKNINLAIRKYIDFSSARDIKEVFSDYLEAKLTRVTDPYFTYKQFLDSWLDKPGVCFVFYENFKKTPESELSKILVFIGEHINQNQLTYAIEYNSFENVTLRKYGKARKPGEEDSSRFQRKGVSGDWINYFNSHACSILDKYMGDHLIHLGYESSNDWVNYNN
jgi:hypothetical protein